ncbi:MAG: hypothetical protein M3Y76_07325 [Chloroflexota bacterium]|nr:hypothetical protein [Chloroflexota bacterium]
MAIRQSQAQSQFTGNFILLRNPWVLSSKRTVYDAYTFHRSGTNPTTGTQARLGSQLGRRL